MRIITIIQAASASLALYLASVPSVLGQTHDRFEGWCDSLQNAAAPDLVQFLKGVVPDEQNSRCVTWAIHKLGDERYEPAIPTLIRLLDFRRPKTEAEKKGFYLRLQVIPEVFPAADALEEIGIEAEPEILRTLEAEATSTIARANAVDVWMEFYKYQRPKGIEVLKQEKIKAEDEAVKKRLGSAIDKALAYCTPADAAACRHAAADDAP